MLYPSVQGLFFLLLTFNFIKVIQAHNSKSQLGQSSLLSQNSDPLLPCPISFFPIGSLLQLLWLILLVLTSYLLITCSPICLCVCFRNYRLISHSKKWSLAFFPPSHLILPHVFFPLFHSPDTLILTVQFWLYQYSGNMMVTILQFIAELYSKL